jgi:hypothetical protein
MSRSQSARLYAARRPEWTINVVAKCGTMYQRHTVNYVFCEKSADLGVLTAPSRGVG